MENQHKKINGYRDLSQEEINLMNEGKELAEQCSEFVTKLQSRGSDLDQRFVSIGKTDLQTGFMALIRGVAQPTTF